MKNKIILLMLLSFVTAFSYQESYEVLAHSTMLDVVYDECEPSYYVDNNNIGDGIDEKWYELIGADNFCHHIYHSENKTTKVINYYVSQTSYEGDTESVTWNTIVNQADRDKLITNIIKGIRAWGNIYYYSMDDSTNILTKTKLFEFVNSTVETADVIIYPSISINYPAVTKVLSEYGYDEIQTVNNIKHWHYPKWKIKINLSLSSNSIEIIKLTGSHEFGHVLGLRDIENVEKSSLDDQEKQNYVNHHDELLMGYGNNSSKNITYKDLAGVMITMGFHTANDHKWMYSPTDYGGYKLICSICNGVKYAPSYPSGSVEFEYCKNLDTDISDHSLSSGNMMPVASYDNYDENGDEYDYYKCKYCRYVAPFTSLVKQNYLRTKIDNNTHKVENIVDSDNDEVNDFLFYTFIEDHYSDYETNTFVPFPTNHAQYALKHIVSCGCNEIQTYRAHGFTVSDIGDGGDYNTCIDCKALIPANTGPGIVGPLSNDIWQVTDNGSYKLTNGIIILVEKDIDAYKKGTLVFKDSNSEIM